MTLADIVSALQEQWRTSAGIALDRSSWPDASEKLTPENAGGRAKVLKLYRDHGPHMKQAWQGVVDALAGHKALLAAVV